jgi:hypothetical protein
MFISTTVGQGRACFKLVKTAVIFGTTKVMRKNNTEIPTIIIKAG